MTPTTCRLRTASAGSGRDRPGSGPGKRARETDPEIDENWIENMADDELPAGSGSASDEIPHPAQLAVGVVGAGRAGTAMAVALARAGHRVVAASGVSQASLDRVSRNLPQAKVARPDEVVEASDLVLLTVPDDVLPALVSGLAETGVAMEGRLMAHA